MSGTVLPLNQTVAMVTARYLVDNNDRHSEDCRSKAQIIVRQLESNLYTAVSEDVLHHFVTSFPTELTGELLCALVPPHLKSLQLKKCQKILGKGLVTDYHHLSMVLKRCSRLQSLSLDNCSLHSSLELCNIITHNAPGLTAISLENCDGVTDAMVQILLQRLPKLKHLNLSMTRQITDKVFALSESAGDDPLISPGSSLTSVDLAGCQQLSSSCIRHLTELCGPTLQSLNVSNTEMDCTMLWYLSGYNLSTAGQLAVLANKDPLGEDTSQGIQLAELLKDLQNLQKKLLDRFDMLEDGVNDADEVEDDVGRSIGEDGDALLDGQDLLEDGVNDADKVEDDIGRSNGDNGDAMIDVKDQDLCKNAVFEKVQDDANRKKDSVLGDTFGEDANDAQHSGDTETASDDIGPDKNLCSSVGVTEGVLLNKLLVDVEKCTQMINLFNEPDNVSHYADVMGGQSLLTDLQCLSASADGMNDYYLKLQPTNLEEVVSNVAENEHLEPSGGECGWNDEAKGENRMQADQIRTNQVSKEIDIGGIKSSRTSTGVEDFVQGILAKSLNMLEREENDEVFTQDTLLQQKVDVQLDTSNVTRNQGDRSDVTGTPVARFSILDQTESQESSEQKASDYDSSKLTKHKGEFDSTHLYATPLCMSTVAASACEQNVVAVSVEDGVQHGTPVICKPSVASCASESEQNTGIVTVSEDGSVSSAIHFQDDCSQMTLKSVSGSSGIGNKAYFNVEDLVQDVLSASVNLLQNDVKVAELGIDSCAKDMCVKSLQPKHNVADSNRLEGEDPVTDTLSQSEESPQEEHSDSSRLDVQEFVQDILDFSVKSLQTEEIGNIATEQRQSVPDIVVQLDEIAVDIVAPENKNISVHFNGRESSLTRTGASAIPITSDVMTIDQSAIDNTCVPPVQDSSLPGKNMDCRKHRSKDLGLKRQYEPVLSSLDICNIKFDAILAKTCLQEFFQANKKLKKLTVSWNELQDSLLEIIAKASGELQCIALFDCENITSLGLSHLLTHCPKLQQLDLQGASFIADYGLMPIFLNGNRSAITKLQLSETNITDSCLSHITKCLSSKLTSLELSWCEEVTETGLSGIASKCTSLQRFHARQGHFSGDSLIALSQNCTGLTCLNLSSVDCLTDDVVVEMMSHLHNMKELDISWNSALTDSSISTVMCNCPLLTQFYAAGLKRITEKPLLPIVADFNRWRRCLALIQIKLRERRVLQRHGDPQCSSDEEYEDLYVPVRSSSYTPYLRYLDLQYCDRMKDKILAQIVAICRGTLTIRDYYGEDIIPKLLYGLKQ